MYTMKKITIVMIIVAIIGIGGYVVYHLITQHKQGETLDYQEQVATKEIQIQNNEGIIELNVEIANTPQEREEGLMRRTHLNENSGMLFIFDTVNTRSFWMKDTLISLDILFLSSNGKIVHIAENTKPNQIDERYPSGEPILYALEVSGGWCKRNKVKTGDTVIIDI